MHSPTPIPLDHESPKRLPGARVALLLLLLINLMNYVDRQILSAVEKPIGNEFNVSAAATGALSTAFFAAYMVFSPVFGFLADRWRRWAIVGIGVIVWSLASGGSGAVTTFGMLIGMRLLVGIGEAAYGPVAPTIIADLYPVAERGKVLAWFYAAIPVGSAIGYVVGGLFHARWHWAFYITLPPGILLGIWCFLMREPVRGASDRAEAKENERKCLQANCGALSPVEAAYCGRCGAAFDAGTAPALEQAPFEKPVISYAPATAGRFAPYLALLKNRSYLIDCAGMTAMTFAFGGVGFFMPRYLEEVGHLAPEKSTPIFGAILVVAGLLGTLCGGMAGDKLRGKVKGSYFVVSAGGMLVGFPLFLLMLFTPFPACWIVVFAAVFCLFFNTGPSNAIIANVTAPTIRGAAYAMNILVIHLLGDVISPPLIGFVRDHHGMKAAFVVVSVMMLVGGVIWLFGAKYLDEDTMRAEGEARGNEAVRQ